MKVTMWMLVVAVSLLSPAVLQAQGKVAEVQVVKDPSTAQVQDASVSKARQLPPIGGDADSYTLGKGDIVDIQVRNNPEFSGKFAVGPDGNIQFTFVGDVKAEGLTKVELRDVLVKELGKYIKIPEVDVTVAAYLSKFVYIIGEVGRPGKYPMQGDTVSLRDLLVGAGLPTREAALRRVFIITPDAKKPKVKKVDIYKLLYKGVLKDNLALKPDQVVVVSATIPAEINRALGVLLEPFQKGQEAGETYDYYKGGGSF